MCPLHQAPVLELSWAHLPTCHGLLSPQILGHSLEGKMGRYPGTRQAWWTPAGHWPRPGLPPLTSPTPTLKQMWLLLKTIFRPPAREDLYFYAVESLQGPLLDRRLFLRTSHILPFLCLSSLDLLLGGAVISVSLVLTDSGKISNCPYKFSPTPYLRHTYTGKNFFLFI